MKTKFWITTTIILGIVAIFLFAYILTPHQPKYVIKLGNEEIYSMNEKAFYTAVGTLKSIDEMCNDQVRENGYESYGCANRLTWSAEVR